MICALLLVIYLIYFIEAERDEFEFNFVHELCMFENRHNYCF